MVARQRLFATLSGGSPIKWIAGAPGAGKTTLAASYTRDSGEKVLWYEVDSGDDDPAAFFFFMRQAAINGGFPKAAGLPLLPPEGAADIASFARRWFAALFAMLRRRAILVIDNFQEASDPHFHTIARVAFEELPEALAVIVISLSHPPPMLARLVANRRIHLVGTDELRFTRVESDDVVLTTLQADPDTLAALHERSAGWAAGLVLMIEHMRRTDARVMPSLDESQEAVFDYFAGEVLASFTPDEQRALMLTALLPRVTAPLAEIMSGRADADRLLDRLHRRHLFVDRRAGESGYQYHRLFKAFLRARGRESLPDEDRRLASERAALSLDAAGEAEDAIAMYLAAGEWDAAARSILQVARRLYDEGRGRTLVEWITALPPDSIETKPWLAYWVGAHQVWTRSPAARETLEQAFEGFARAGDVAGQILAAGALTRACILGPDWRPLDGWIANLETLLSGDTTSLASDVLLTGYSRLIYATLARDPQHPHLPRWAGRASALLTDEIEPNDALLAAFSLLTYYVWTGQTSLGDPLIRQVEPLTSHGRLSVVSLVYWLWAHASHTLRVGDPTVALNMIDRALELASSNGLTIGGVIRRHRVAFLLTLGRIDEAERELDQLATAVRVEPYFELRAWLALRKGDFGLALKEVEVALRQATERGRNFYRMLDVHLLCGVHAAAGATTEAIEALQRYREMTARAPGELAAFHASLIEAHVALSQGDRDAGHRALRRALEIGERQRYRSWWGWDAAIVAPLVSEAIEHGIHVGYCRDLVTTHRLVPQKPDLEHWPWPVRIRTLGRFEVQVDGKPLRFEGKAQRKPLELLKILIAAGDSPVSIERLVDLLWVHPDDGGRKAFDITTHRLRKLLGLDAAVEVVDRHASLSSRFVWVDAWALDRILQPLDSVDGQVPPERLEADAPRVLSLFTGAFLDGDAEAPWQLVARHRMTNRFQRFALQLGSELERRGQWERACDLYQRVVELDPLAEVFYRRQMVCLREQDRRAEAIDVFRRCRHLLSITLGVVPAKETERLYRELSTGQS